jgi:hypothetical protein
VDTKAGFRHRNRDRSAEQNSTVVARSRDTGHRLGVHAGDRIVAIEESTQDGPPQTP